MAENKSIFEINIKPESEEIDLESSSNLIELETLDTSIDSMGISIDIVNTSDENIIESYISSLNTDKEVSLTDKAIEITQKDDEQSKILGAALNLDVSTGEEFNQTKMVKDMINSQPIEIGDGDFDEVTSRPRVSSSFTANDLRQLATLRANHESRFNTLNMKRDLSSINNSLKNLVTEEKNLREEMTKLTEVTKRVQENYIELSQAEDMLRNWNDTSKRNLNLLERLSKKNIGKMDIPSEKLKAEEERQRCLKYYDRIQERSTKVKEEIKSNLLERQRITVLIEKTLDTVDVGSSEEYIKANCAKIVGIDFGTKYYSADFKEYPVYIECQCGCINKRTIDHVPVYSASSISEYKDIRANMYQHEKTKFERIAVPAITFDVGEDSEFRCDECRKVLTYPPNVIQNFAERSCAQEIHSIDIFYKESRNRREVPSGSSRVKMSMGPTCFPDSYIKKLGIIEYYESKTRTISVDPLESLTANKMSDSDERVVRILNPNIDDDMLNVVLKSHRNHLSGIDAYLDDLLQNQLTLKSKAENQKAIERNMLVSAMRKLIINNRWLIVTYCVLQNVSVTSLQDKFNQAFKTTETVRKLRKEFLRFFIDHILDSITKGSDIIIVGTDRKTSLIEGKRTKLPHQYFFKYYRSIISFYFQVRTRTVNAQRELELFTEVLQGYNTIPNIEDEEMARLESEKFVAKIIKDMNSLLNKEFDASHNVLVTVNNKREKLAKTMLEKLNSSSSLIDSNGEVFAWVKYEIEKNLEIDDSHPYNSYVYNMLYATE